MASVQDIYDEITRIDNAKQGIAEAIEEKGVQVPEESRIGEYPGLVRQIQTGSPDAVLYTPQELTPEQQEQARENIGAGTYTKPDTGIPKTDLAAGVQTSLGNADTALQPAALTPITELIPAQATPQNQLADKNFVNSSVATNTANYISDNGQPFQSVADLEAYTGTLTNNDYAFVVGTDSAGNTTYTRYKYNANTQTWAAEYVLNNSSFTAEQWAAISSGITALLVQKLSDLPTEVVTYVAQTLTEAQKQQARTNIGATAPEIFWATYGTTTAAEIDAAVAAGKIVVCLYDGIIYLLTNAKSTEIRYLFSAFSTNTRHLYLTCTKSNSSWFATGVSLELTSNKVNTISGNETATDKYPSTKAVADALGKMGVISQKQVWSGHNYTLSDIVRGLIPQANIDLYEAAGVVFNSTTGYFELNGLTDISYREMQVIYSECASSMFAQNDAKLQNALSARTNLIIRYTPYESFGNIYATLSVMCRQCPNLETMMLPGLKGAESVHNPESIQMNPRVTVCYFGYNSTRLKRVIGVFDMKNITSPLNTYNAIERSTHLEYCLIDNLQVDIKVGSSYFLLESVVFMIDGAINSAAITITLHADAYARCQADTTEYTYNGQIYTGIIAYAAAKNITIASA